MLQPLHHFGEQPLAAECDSLPDSVLANGVGDVAVDSETFVVAHQGAVGRWVNRVLMLGALAGTALMASDAQAQVPPPPEFTEAQIQSQIKEIETYLESKFGFKVVYGDLTQFLKQHSLKGTPAYADHRILDAMKKLKQAFDEKYDPGMIRKHHLKGIYLVANLMYVTKDKDQGIGGVTVDKGLILDLNNDISYSVHHELFHHLDSLGEGGEDDRTWAKANPHGEKDYKFANGLDANINAGTWDMDVTGFANTYGKNGGALEDQATFATALLNPNWTRELLKRAASDPVVSLKITMITGCAVSSDFVGPALSEKDYKKRTGFSGYHYYPKWSQKKGGKPVMDCKYWNDIVKVAISQEEAAERQEEARRREGQAKFDARVEDIRKRAARAMKNRSPQKVYLPPALWLVPTQPAAPSLQFFTPHSNE